MEIWNEHETELLCSHELVPAGLTNVFDIKAEHMPPKSYRFGEWDSERFKRWARTVGPYTFQVIDRLFANPPEQKYYSRAHAILNLENKYSKERLETACRLATEKYRYVPSSKQIRSILEYGEDIKDLKKRQNAKRSSEKAYTRGAEYYAGKK